MLSPLDSYYRAKRRHERLTRLELARLQRLKETLPVMEIESPSSQGDAVFFWVSVILIAVLFSGGMI